MLRYNDSQGENDLDLKEFFFKYKKAKSNSLKLQY